MISVLHDIDGDAPTDDKEDDSIELSLKIRK